ncbi:hypothetical protein [Neptuniibacter sp. QD37_11]|uniref:hypothetical protein n=1 Tax=Neptuniibacter sp. QD37_11 TaxID=3398209 RepID=UPI0039F54EBD
MPNSLNDIVAQGGTLLTGRLGYENLHIYVMSNEVHSVLYSDSERLKKHVILGPLDGVELAQVVPEGASFCPARSNHTFIALLQKADVQVPLDHFDEARVTKERYTAFTKGNLKPSKRYGGSRVH